MSEIVVQRGLEVPEGPVLLPDGRVAFVEQLGGRVSAYADGKVEEVATGLGAWNAVTLGSDGFLYAAQNSGIVGSWDCPRPTMAGIERIGLDGSVDVVANRVGGVDAVAPNDLAFGPDGRLYFTDPAAPYDPAARGHDGRLFALGLDGDGEVLLDVGAVYCNGIGFDANGRLLWVESYDRHVCFLDEEGRRRVLCQLPEEHVPDGFAVSTDGRIFIATPTSHGITVISPEGEFLGWLELDDNAFPTNVCFDGHSLFVTDFTVDFESDPASGRLWRLDTDATGAPLHHGQV